MCGMRRWETGNAPPVRPRILHPLSHRSELPGGAVRFAYPGYNIESKMGSSFRWNDGMGCPVWAPSGEGLG